MKKLFILFICSFAAWGQVTVVQSPVPKFRSFLPSGAPNVGGCVYTFATGTSTPQATYTDSTGSTTNSNPVILDGNGEAPIWITNATYRFQVWSFGSGTIGSNCGNGAQMYQIDGIRDTGLAPTANPLSIAAVTNAIDIIALTRATDVSPSGNYLNFKSLAGATVFKVDINGNISANGLSTSSGLLNAANGSDAGPAYSFSSEPTTGFWWPAAGQIAVTAAGTKVAVFGTGRLAIRGLTALGFATGDPFTTSADIGISRVSAGVLGIGNGAAGDTTGNLQLNLISKYGTVATAGQGMPGIFGATNQKAETGAADANVLTFTPLASTGLYRACFVASVSSATAGVISWTLSWTDSNGNAQSNIAQDLFQDGTAAPATTFTTSAAGNYHFCRELDINNAAASIIVKWVGGGTTAAKVSATVERLI